MPPPPQAYGLKAANWPAPASMDFARGAPPPYSYTGYGGLPPAAYVGYVPPPGPPTSGYYEPWTYTPFTPGGFVPPNDPIGIVGPPSGRRLSERVGGYADLPMAENLPARPMSFSGEVGRGRRAPPPDAKEDPRASGGRKISYHDIDKAAVGDDTNIELSY